MKSLSFRWQLILFILLICVVTLSLAFAGFYLYDVRQFNAVVAARLEITQQQMVGTLVPLLEQNPANPTCSLASWAWTGRSRPPPCMPRTARCSTATSGPAPVKESPRRGR